MRIKALHQNFILPTKGSEKAGAFDIYMPEDGHVSNAASQIFKLGFASEVPEGMVALILPRSSTGVKMGLELNNTCGVIDSDYRGEWMASLKTKNIAGFNWSAGDRILQFVVVPVYSGVLELVEELGETTRGTGGFGSSGR